jgi:hypothetical protein
MAQELLKAIAEGEAGGKWNVRLHIGDPGVEGKNNPATENAQKDFKFDFAGLAAHKYEQKNVAAMEWVEVKKEEEYLWISVWASAAKPELEVFKINIKLTEGVKVKVGDTFRINIGKLIIKLVKE